MSTSDQIQAGLVTGALLIALVGLLWLIGRVFRDWYQAGRAKFAKKAPEKGVYRVYTQFNGIVEIEANNCEWEGSWLCFRGTNNDSLAVFSASEVRYVTFGSTEQTFGMEPEDQREESVSGTGSV